MTVQEFFDGVLDKVAESVAAGIVAALMIEVIRRLWWKIGGLGGRHFED